MWCANQQSLNLHNDSQFALSVSCEENLAVVRGKTVSVHSRETLKELLQLNFETEVNAVCWTGKNGRFLLVAEHSGCLHTVHVRSQLVINSEKVYQTYNDVSRTFKQLLYVEESGTMYALGSGELHCYMNMDYQALDKALCEGSMQKATLLKQKIVHSTATTPTGTNWFIPDIGTSQIAVTTLGEESSCLNRLLYSPAEGKWRVEALMALYGYGSILTGFKVTPKYLLSLTDKGFLILWSTLTYTAVKIWTDVMVDQMAPLTPISHSVADCKIVVYSRDLTGTKTGFLSILSLPKCELVYKLPVNGAVLSEDYISQLSVHYIHGVVTDSTQLTSIALISSESRFKMMIAKQQYEEALIFGKKHQLDIQGVYEAQAKHLSTGLSVQTAARFNSCLDDLSDTHSVVDICMQSSSSIPSIVKQVYKYSLKRLENSQHWKCTCDRMVQVLNSLQRFETFSLACGGPSNFTAESWRCFSSCDLLCEVLKLGLSNCVSAAMIIWSRHKCELTKEMTVGWLDKFLGCLSPSLDGGTVVRWLSDHVVPVVDRIQSVEHSELLSSHIERLARDYELSDKERWPSNSLELCSLIEEVRSPLLCVTLSRLKLLRDNLKAVEELKEVYNCSLSYAVYCEQSRESIVYRLLDVVAVPSMFKHHYENVAKPYMTQYCIHPDKNLLNYVKDLIGRYQYIRGYDCTGLLWEQKAVAVIDCITLPSYKVTAVVELAKHCQTPWSKCISDIVERACLLTTEDVEELNDIRKRSLLSHLLSTYNVPKEVTPGPTNAIMLIRYILKQSSQSLTGIQHALQVAQALVIEEAEVYRFACHARLMSLTDIYDILAVMPNDSVRQVLNYTIDMSIELFRCRNICDWDVKVHWAEVSISLLNNPHCDIDESYFSTSLTILSGQLRSLVTLKTEFGLEVNYPELSSPEDIVVHLRGILHQVLDPVITSHQEDLSMVRQLTAILSGNMWRLRRFSQLTGLDKSMLYKCIYDETYRTSTSSATKVLRIVLEGDKSGYAVKFVLSKLKGLLNSAYWTVDNAKELFAIAQTCATYSNADEIVEAVSVLNMARYYLDVMSNCLGGDDEQDMTSEVDKVDLEALFTRKHHTEKDLMISTSKVTEMTTELTMWVLSPYSAKVDAKSCLEVFESFHQLLTSNSHDLLAIRACLHLFHSAMCMYNSAPDMVEVKYLMCRKLKQSVDSLLSKLFSQRNLDVELTLTALLELPIRSSLSLVKKNVGSSGSQFLRMLSMANIASVLCHTNNQLDFHDICLSIKQEAIWGYILNKYGVSFLSVLNRPNKGDLLVKMACKCPLGLTKEYIRDFSLTVDTEHTYLTRIQHLANSHDQTPFWEVNTDGEALLEIKALLAMMSLQPEVIGNLVDTCNPYNYSLIHTLLLVGGPLVQKRLKLLDFLSLYKRVAPPSAWELSYIKDFYLDRGDNYIPDISHTRLPYHPLVKGNIWKIIRSEMSVKTFRILQPITSLLEIKTDVFMLNVALQIAETHIGYARKKADATSGADVSAATWCHDDDIDAKFFDDIMTVLGAIQDKKSAVMCSQALIDKVPSGVEKVLVTKLCVDLAGNWNLSLQQGSEEQLVAESLLRKVTTMHRVLQIEQILNLSNLAFDSLLRLIEHPALLVQSILETTHTDSAHRAAEKFEACSSIADITGRDITKICYDIVSDCWLGVGSPDTQANIDMDMTMTIDMATMMSAVQESTNQSAADDCTIEKWIVNLANSSIGPKIVHLLNSILNGIASSNKTKLLVVKCFLLLGDTSLANLTNKKSPSDHVLLTHEELSRQYKALRYIGRLQSLNISMSVEEFYSCDSSALIAKLRKNYSNNPTAVELYADLCVDSLRYDMPIWKTLLLHLVQLKMVDKLTELLPLTADQTQLWLLDVYKEAWQLVVDRSSSSDTCLSAVLSCPILERLHRRGD